MIFNFPFENVTFYYLIFLCPRSGNKGNRGVELCHCTRNALKIRRSGERSPVPIKNEKK